MATSGGLIEIVADALGLTAETVGVHVRNLRTAGLLNRRGVGRSAAIMTTLDAARVLLAVVGSQQVKDSAETVKRFGALVSAEGVEAASRGEDINPFTLEHALAAEFGAIAQRWPNPRTVANAEYRDTWQELDDSKVIAGPALQLFTTLGVRTPVTRGAVLRRFADRRDGKATLVSFGHQDAEWRAVDEASFSRATGAPVTQASSVPASALVEITRRL